MTPPPLANVLQPLIDAFEAVLTFFHDSVGFGWGASIIALTVVVRAALLPLAIKQYHSMQGLARVAPQLKALQEKYKDDRQRLQQETMRFYQENKVNPFGSCLPLLAQMPVFIALFYLLQDDLRKDICPELNRRFVENPKPCGETGASQFLFIPDITNKATGVVLITLMVLYVGSQLISSVLMATTADRTQRMIFIALPFVFIPFIMSFPAGLIVYWITTNLWTVVQQYTIRRLVGHIQPQPAAVPAGARSAAPPTRRPRPADNPSDGASAQASARPRGSAPPPPPPRKKKKRSGRRR